MKTFVADLRASLASTLLIALLFSGAYPLAVYGVGRAFFRGAADGSLLRDASGGLIGSALVGQPFSGATYFHPRPSAAGSGYDGTSSGGTNLGPLSKKLLADVAGRVATYREENGLDESVPVPADAVTSSGSGLDPHVSPENAGLQAGRVAAARGVAKGAVLARVAYRTEGRTFGLLGAPRVNVLLLNLDLDRDFPAPPASPGGSGAAAAPGGTQ